MKNKSQANKRCDTRICFTEVRFLQTYSPLRKPQRPGLFQHLPSLKRSLGPSELLLLKTIGTQSSHKDHHTIGVSCLNLQVSLISRKIEKEKKQSKRKSSKEHNKSLSLDTKALGGIGRGFDHLSVSCIECLALVGGWKCENLEDRKSTRLNSSHITRSRMPSSA